jgi:hypothetical protein
MVLVRTSGAASARRYEVLYRRANAAPLAFVKEVIRA